VAVRGVAHCKNMANLIIPVIWFESSTIVWFFFLANGNLLASMKQSIARVTLKNKLALNLLC